MKQYLTQASSVSLLALFTTTIITHYEPGTHEHTVAWLSFGALWLMPVMYLFEILEKKGGGE